MKLPDHILDVFREEARDHLVGIEQGFLDLEVADDGETQQKIVAELFRRAHSLKGASRAVQLVDLQNAAQALEETLDGLRKDADSLPHEGIEHGLAQFDQVRQCFDAWSQPASVDEGKSSNAPGGDDAFTVRVSAERLDRMLNVAGEIRTSHRTGEWHVQQLAEIGERLSGFSPADLDLPPDVALQVQSTIGGWQAATLDQLQRLQHESRRRQVREQVLLESLEADIHEARLLPLTMLADSSRRVVRDLAQSLGKSIRFEVDVGTVLLDKAVIEALKDPLLHLIRNSAHHAIETPDVRQAANKPREGCIHLQAQRRGDRVQITIVDDGRGVDYQRVRDVLTNTTGLTEDDVAELSDDELAQHLFAPGFTTKAAADEFSGRGVGLDVVQDTVQRLHGSVQLAHSSPRGTTFVIVVPVTISTARILTVISGGQHYGIPSSSVVRAARLRREDLAELEGRPVLNVNGAPVPWIVFNDLVGTTAVPAAKGQAVPYVLIDEGGRQVALEVDDTDDESEVILKPLGFPLAGMPGIVGGTVRPNGAVQLVLDVSSLLAQVSKKPLRKTRAHKQHTARVLVADDSPTTRRIVRGLLAAAGYEIYTASDGVDALEVLRRQPVDLVVSDVQMPRMTGLELTRQIKSRYRLPVILVTGMERDEDRREGLSAGADAYVVKSSFAGDGLLEIVKQFV